MVKQLLNHIRRHNLCKTTDKILLAVSGGVDSMTMLHLFRQAGFTIGVAHCNFQLRGEASAADEALVKQVCEAQDIPFYCERFDTGAYAKQKGLSIQMAARELRYDFFNRLLVNYSYQYVATAHHLNDALETILLNLTKGTGMEGLAGIPLKNERIIRPLLFSTREMLMDYATLQALQWRDDASNASDDYQRNFLRHQVIPKLREINPNLERTFQNTQARITGAVQFARFYIDQFREKAVHDSDEHINIDKRPLLQSVDPSVLLWELIKDKGFNFDQCVEIVSDHQPGKKICSASHTLFVDREYYMLRPNRKDGMDRVSIEEGTRSLKTDRGILSLQALQKENFGLKKEARWAQLDLNKVTYPLVWREWQPGDSFVPFGMNQSKKLSDFLTDLKVPLPDKSKVTVLESAGTIVWVVGFRINEHFKVTADTSRILAIEFSGE